MKRILMGLVLGLLTLWLGCSGCYVVEPAGRGVVTTLGTMSERAVEPGVHFKTPFVSRVEFVSVRQHTDEVRADAFSSENQHLGVTLKIMWRIPESFVVSSLKDYSGEPFPTLVAPRVQEALKAVTAQHTAEESVKKREEIKVATLALVREKLGATVLVEDVVIENIELSKELMVAIEAKMVQEQTAARARFTQEQSRIEAETAVITAKGEAEANRIRGESLKSTPDVVTLKIIEKWNGVAPLYVGGGTGGGPSMLLPAAVR